MMLDDIVRDLEGAVRIAGFVWLFVMSTTVVLALGLGAAQFIRWVVR